jgi:antitoxin component of RelBE/YafQ-DinJ toxin-antitoxin module
MAANKLVQARIDGTIKEEAAAVGLTVSDAADQNCARACVTLRLTDS